MASQPKCKLKHIIHKEKNTSHNLNLQEHKSFEETNSKASHQEIKNPNKQPIGVHKHLILFW